MLVVKHIHWFDVCNWVPIKQKKKKDIPIYIILPYPWVLSSEDECGLLALLGQCGPHGGKGGPHLDVQHDLGFPIPWRNLYELSWCLR